MPHIFEYRQACACANDDGQFVGAGVGWGGSFIRHMHQAHSEAGCQAHHVATNMQDNLLPDLPALLPRAAWGSQPAGPLLARVLLRQQGCRFLVAGDASRKS
jgi:hypothetical protein